MSLWEVPLGTRSAASLCSGSSGLPFALLLCAIVFIPATLAAQLTTGVIEGTLRSADGRPAVGGRILVTGGTGFRTVVACDANGEFSITLPYGQYQLFGDVRHDSGSSGATVFDAPLETKRLDLVVDASGTTHSVESGPARTPGIWIDTTAGHMYPEALGLAGLLLSREPSSVTAPLDLTGLADNRLAIVSQRAFSWTATQFKLQSMDATDSYQPGVPAVLPDIQALEAVVVRSGFAQPTSSSLGTEVGLFLSEPGVRWHGSLSDASTGSALFSTNLPPLPSRGLVQQPQQFLWFTRDRLEIGGPITRRADFFASAAGQWASQTEPLSAGSDQRSRLLFGNASGRVRLSATDRFDALYSGSRINLTDGGVPAGLEALTGNRMAPSFVLPGGFSGEAETDHLDFLQAGWTHQLSAASGLGIVQVRYGYAIAHLDTSTASPGQSLIELVGGAVTEAAPLGNLAVRPRHQIEAAWQPAVLRALGIRHRIVAGAGWKRSDMRNRFSTPSGLNLITANGAPVFVMEFNTPLDSREQVRSFSAYFGDHLSLASSLSLDFGALADFSRGSLPEQSSPRGYFAPARVFAAQPDLIDWNNVSPRVGFAWQAPHSHGLVFRGTYFRLYAPLAGRYLDFGNPNSLGGSAFQWLAPDSSAPFVPGQQGNLLWRFGGPYSSISPSLGRPYSDEFDVGGEFALSRRSFASIHLFRRDDKNRIAAIDTGVPFSAFTPVSILDPGPDGIQGTFDDQRLIVYAQNPATLGQDRYLLTNPAGLRTLESGLAAEAQTELRRLTLHASFVAEKSYGPTNPGDAVYQNDPGVIGALFLDPNTAIHAAGRSFVDRAYVGKIQATYRLPPSWGGFEIASVANYLDGLVFARKLLVTGLPQGPLLVAATVRGSPEGGNRAQYLINWNIRFSRRFGLPFGSLGIFADVFSATNAGQKLQEIDLSGPSFNRRLPAAIQTPRSVRIGFRYDF
jgi:hypothetical protein